MKLYVDVPGLQENDSNKRLKIVKSLVNQELLAFVAKNDPEGFIRRAAVVRIKNETLLADVAKNATDDLVWRNAIKRINDDDLLVDIARNASNELVCNIVLKRINDNDLLVDIVNSSNGQAQNAAIKCINDDAINQIDDEVILAKIVKSHSNDDIRRKAVKKIKDNNILMDIVKNSRNENISILAISCINNDDLLYDLIRYGAGSKKICNAALKRIERISLEVDAKLNNHDYFYQNSSNINNKKYSSSSKDTKISSKLSADDFSKQKIIQPVSKINEEDDGNFIFDDDEIIDKYEKIDEQLSELPIFTEDFEEEGNQIYLYINENLTAIYDIDEKANLRFKELEIIDELDFVEKYALRRCADENWEEYFISNNYVYLKDGTVEKSISIDEILENHKRYFEKILTI